MGKQAPRPGTAVRRLRRTTIAVPEELLVPEYQTEALRLAGEPAVAG